MSCTSHYAQPVGHCVGSPIPAFCPPRILASRTRVYDCWPISIAYPRVQFPVPCALSRWERAVLVRGLQCHRHSDRPGPLTCSWPAGAVTYEKCQFSAPPTPYPRPLHQLFAPQTIPEALWSYPENLEKLVAAVPELRADIHTYKRRMYIHR